jgi:putative flippase GtrA
MKDTDIAAFAPPAWTAPALAGPRSPAVAGATLRRLALHPLAAAFSRFLGVGLVGLAVDASIFTAMDLAHVRPEISRAVSLGVATLVTWRLNRRHTFGASGRRPGVEAARYAAVALCAQGFSYAVFLSLVYAAPALPRLMALLVGAGLAAVAGFAGHKLFAFAPTRAKPRHSPVSPSETP